MYIKLFHGGLPAAGGLEEAVIELLAGLPFDKAMMNKHDNRRLARSFCTFDRCRDDVVNVP